MCENKFKPFDLEKAKTGAPVVTADGRRVRILCFDREHHAYPLAALISESNGYENVCCYTESGRFRADMSDSLSDLRMALVKKSGWVNIYKSNTLGIPAECAKLIFPTEHIASINIGCAEDFIKTVEIEWEE